MRTARLVLAWCDLYTRGLDSAVVADRRDELASDLFEHSTWDPAGGRAILSRAVRGVPADLSWRFEQQRVAAQGEPRSARVVRASLGALVLAAASSLIVFGVFAISRTASSVARGEALPWSETAMWVIGLTGLAAVGVLLTLAPRSRVLGAVVLAASSAVIHFGLFDLMNKSATIGALSYTPGWSTAIVLLIAAYVVLFVAAAILWLPQNPPQPRRAQ